MITRRLRSHLFHP